MDKEISTRRFTPAETSMELVLRRHLDGSVDPPITPRVPGRGFARGGRVQESADAGGMTPEESRAFLLACADEGIGYDEAMRMLTKRRRLADGGTASSRSERLPALRDRDFDIARAVEMARKVRTDFDDGSSSPVNALPFEGADLPSGTSDPEGGRRFMGMLGATAASAADPLGVTSWALDQAGAEGPATALREAYAGEPVAAGVGGFLTPLGVLARPVDVIARAIRAARKPAAGAAGFYAATDSDATASGGKVKPSAAATQADLLADVERRASPTYNPLADARSELASVEARISKDVAELNRIGSTSLPGNAVTANASRERMSTPISDRIKEDQKRAAFLRTVIDELGEVDKPLRERYGAAGTAAVVAPTAAAYLLSRGAYTKLAKGLEETVDAAREAERAGRSVDVIRQGQIAGDKVRRLGPAQIATGVGAALLPIEGQGLVDAIDYKSAPKWTRAYREAEETFKDPAAWLQKQAVPAAAGAAAALAGYKTAMLAPVSEARSYARTAEAFDPRGPLTRSLIGRSAPEEIAPRYAMDVARSSRAEELAARSGKSAELARLEAAEARGQASLAEGQADFDETVARALAAARAPTITTPASVEARSRYLAAEPQPALPSDLGSRPASLPALPAGDATQASQRAIPASSQAPVPDQTAVRSSVLRPASPSSPSVASQPRPLTAAQKDRVKDALFKAAEQRGSFNDITFGDLALPKAFRADPAAVDAYISTVRAFANRRAARLGSNDVQPLIKDLRQLRDDGVRYGLPLAVASGAANSLFGEEETDREASIDRAMRAARREPKKDGGSAALKWHHSWDQTRDDFGRWR
jgi:hypothetical protein